VSTPTAYLTGTVTHPVLRLRFSRGARTPDGLPLLAQVKQLPGRRWLPDEGVWEVTGTGTRPQATMDRLGVQVDMTSMASDPRLARVRRLGQLVTPVAKRSKSRPGVVLVRHRLAGFEEARMRLGAGAVWDRQAGRFEVPLGDMLDADGHPRAGVRMSEGLVRAAKAARTAQPVIPGASELASASSMRQAGRHAEKVIARVGDVPDWFGACLYPHQRAGALAAAAGHRLLADEMGLGKTLSALAAVAITGTARLLVICPPVALTSWQRQTALSKAASVPAWGHGQRAETEAVIVAPGRKTPVFPDQGAVIVSDSLLASRPDLVARVLDWAPDSLIVDEVHRHKTWASKRSGVVRDIAWAVPGLRLGLSGTPMFANPIELVGPLAITGQLDSVFGGFDQFATRYARQDKWGRWHARKQRLGELRRVFDERVWVRRVKDQVLDLPAKTRQDLICDVDLSAFRRAHRAVQDKITDWVDQFHQDSGRLPDEGEVAGFSRDSISLVSNLRQAAGLAKVQAATDHIAEWVAQCGTSTDEQGRTVYDRPLVVWTHHNAVSEAMAAAVPEAVGDARVIMGGTSNSARTRIVDDFQAGLVPVLVASITAAGVGITLTRGCDALFVETDWTPALVQQAEDRCHRIGSDRPVTVTTMVAPGTLDEQVQKVLADKGEILEAFMGPGQDVSVVEFEGEHVAPAEIVADMTRRVLRRMSRSQTVGRAA